MIDDPFSPEHDPSPPPRVTRRALAGLALGTIALAPVVKGCATTRRLACSPKRPGFDSCQMRFCRYWREG